MAQPSIHEGQSLPVIQQQRVIIRNKYGEKLVGVLHETGSAELVILCHGYRCSKENKTFKNLAAALEEEGISVFRFDFAGNGESEGSFQYGNYRREAEDLHAVVLHFSEAKRLISAILGHSKGGNVVLLYASTYSDVHTVINASGRFNLERGNESHLGTDFLQRIRIDGIIDVKDDTVTSFIRTQFSLVYSTNWIFSPVVAMQPLRQINGPSLSGSILFSDFFKILKLGIINFLRANAAS
ncbi:uncharacterized protein LOC122082737 isoform X2 [Macadamia integrifolia]|uniref:uncharacterized protein LOC122082737 isoform X2 n=1 Tax=Macadamia integrifolia TaxID=60698 RepID=UPI001C4F1BAC|nr:uncharacterized protein LOC122082737 isoform X2 [Macadamia integrifolia]